MDEDGNSIFCNKVTNLWADYNLGSENGANYSISYRMKFAADKEGQLETHIRKTCLFDMHLSSKIVPRDLIIVTPGS